MARLDLLINSNTCCLRHRDSTQSLLMILVTWAEIRNSSLGFLFCSFLFQTELIILERDCLGVIDNCFFSDFFTFQIPP